MSIYKIRNMRVIEQIHREILYQAIEKKQLTQTQLGLSLRLKTSISVVNYAIKPLREMGAIAGMPRGFRITDTEKILYYWASIRSLQKDIIYSTRAEAPVSDIENSMPNDIVFSAYTAYKHTFKDAPADYSEIYIYSKDLSEIKNRFPPSKNTPNIFVLKADKNIEKYGKTTTIANTFVDLWNIKEWYAKDYIKAIKEKLHEH